MLLSNVLRTDTKLSIFYVIITLVGNIILESISIKNYA